MRTENWCGYDIRFVEIDGEWYAILKDICDALRLRTDKIASRLSPTMLERVLVETSNHPSKVVGYEHKPVDRIDRGAIGKDIVVVDVTGTVRVYPMTSVISITIRKTI